MAGIVDRFGSENPDFAGFDPSDRASAGRFLTVSELNRSVAAALQGTIGRVRVGGEISSFTRAASGHCYFTLKDASASVRAVMFRGVARALDFQPREGLQVEVDASAGLYEARGEFQLGVERMRIAGDGDLYRRFVELKARLQAEGLFDAARKRALPDRIGRIGIVSSAGAAALRDVLTTLARRSPRIEVVLYPALVQGAQAPLELVAALAAANRRDEVDVLLLVRGGGSLEDLQAFNDERLARAVAASRLPIVCGVGHETDFSICDFIADLRAATPTAAAVAVSRDRRDDLAQLRALALRLGRAGERGVLAREQALDIAARRLRSPARQFADRREALAGLGRRLAGRLGRQVGDDRARFEQLHARLNSRLRGPGLDLAADRIAGLAGRLVTAIRRSLDGAEQGLSHREAALALIDPRRVVARGYAIVRDGEGRLVRSATELGPGTGIAVELARGSITATVDAVVIRPSSTRATIDSSGSA